MRRTAVLSSLLIVSGPGSGAREALAATARINIAPPGLAPSPGSPLTGLESLVEQLPGLPDGPQAALDKAFDMSQAAPLTAPAVLGQFSNGSPSISAAPAAERFGAGPRPELPLPARLAAGWRNPTILWKAAAGLALLAGAALFPDQAWLGGSMLLLPLIGMVADGGSGSSGNGRGAWEENFRADSGYSLEPGDMFVTSRTNSLLAEGEENGALFKIKASAVGSAYLYALYRPMPGASAHLNARIDAGIVEAVRQHNAGKNIAALATLGRTREALMSYSGEGRDAGLNLVDWLEGNSLAAIFRDYAKSKNNGLPREVSPLVRSVLSRLVFARNASWEGSAQEIRFAVPPIQRIAPALSKDLHLSPELRPLIEGFADRIAAVKGANQHKSIWSLLLGTSKEAFPAYRTLMADRALSSTALETLAAFLNIDGTGDELRTRRHASDILGNQLRLPRAILRDLADTIENGDRDARQRAAALLLAQKPDNKAAREILRSPESSAPPRNIHEADANALVSDRWAVPLDVPFDWIKKSALREFRQSFGKEADPSSFRDFLRRAGEYTTSPQRFLREAVTALGNGTWDQSLLAPAAQRYLDLQLKLNVERRLAFLVPRAARLATSKLAVLGFPNTVTGIMLIGDFAKHPSTESELDVLVVTEDGNPHTPDAFRVVLERVLNWSGFIPSIVSGLIVHGVIRANSLNFWRELQLGSSYVDARRGSLVKSLRTYKETLSDPK